MLRPHTLFTFPKAKRSWMGVKPKIAEIDLYRLVIGIAEKRVGKTDLAAYLRQTCGR